MPRLLAVFAALMSLVVSVARAQDAVRAGDPPVASLITVSAPDANGLVTLTGAAGTVFPGAQIAIRNLYTDALVYTQGGITGAFSAQIPATPNTPFWISPAPTIPNTVRNRPGSLPGGPGTIIYGSLPTTTADSAVITQLVIDGDLSEWANYPTSLISPGVHTLVNQNSFYVGIDGKDIPAEYQRAEVIFTLDGTKYTLGLDPRLQEQTATLRRVDPNPTDIGTLAVAATQTAALELRIPLDPFSQVVGAVIDSATLEQFRFVDVAETEIANTFVTQPSPIVDEVDGVVYPAGRLDNQTTLFSLAGTLARGAHTWQALGRVNSLNFQTGDALRMQLDVSMTVPNLPAGLNGLNMTGQLILQPVTGANGVQTAGGLYSNNGWSNVVTPSGLVIENLHSEILLGEATALSPQVLRIEDQLVFGLDFALTIPDTLPAGLYVPVFRGFGQVGDGEIFGWEENGLLGSGNGDLQPAWNRLPLVFNVGEIESARLVWTLFQDQPSSGSRGLMALEDEGALSNRVRFNSPTYILPRFFNGTDEPITYPLEPYLLNQMPNLYTVSSAPLVPFLFPGGRLDIQVKKPDGTIDNLNSTPILQNQLSTATQDERTLFGAQSQVDVYRLTTLAPEIESYQFDQYGLYEITLGGNLEDIWGNRYEGGGVYSVLVAEVFDILPGALSGTPYEVGDAFNPSLRLMPGAAADITITVRIYPVDGSDVVEREFTGTSNSNGYFHAANDLDLEPLIFETSGEYVIDYEARFTDNRGRLWAGSLRSAGVIAERDSVLIAHGQRGLANDFPPPEPQRPAWFTTAQYAPNINNPLLYYPYFAGDVLWYADGGVVNPTIQVQDTVGAYTDALSETATNTDLLAARDELPVFTFDAVDAYTYVSVVRPGIAVRQYVQGGLNGGLPLAWDANDPNNGQTGAGALGEQPGDYVFLFGGAVVRGETVRETAIYAAMGIVIESENGIPRVFPPYSGQAAGPNGGALLLVGEQPVEMFFHPTGVQPGQVLSSGDTFAVSGHVAPPLHSIVDVTITDPNGSVRQFEGTANHAGYFYNPQNDFAANLTGVWKITITVRHEGLTSAGMVQPPYPQGGVLGAVSSTYEVYVVPTDASPLEWNDTREDFPVPASTPFNFNFPIPGDWTNVQVTHTATIPGTIVETGTLQVSGGSFSYQFSPAKLNGLFPNLEINTPTDGASGSDPVTLTFAVTGVNALGQPQIRTRTFHILHDRLVTLQ